MRYHDLVFCLLFYGWFSSAIVWGASAKHSRGQKVGLDHVLEDEDGRTSFFFYLAYHWCVVSEQLSISPRNNLLDKNYSLRSFIRGNQSRSVFDVDFESVLKKAQRAKSTILKTGSGVGSPSESLILFSPPPQEENRNKKIKICVEILHLEVSVSTEAGRLCP